MNIPKAIEILLAKAIRANQTEDFEYGDALKLGIEALERVEMYQKSPLVGNPLPLPSETKD